MRIVWFTGFSNVQVNLYCTRFLLLQQWLDFPGVEQISGSVYDLEMMCGYIVYAVLLTWCVRGREGGTSGYLYTYWAIQAGLLTPLTFAQHCLSPLAAFTSGTYFLQNGRW